MIDRLKKRVKEGYIKLREENINEDEIITGGVDSLTLGCFLDNNCDIDKCRSYNYQAEDSFLIKKEDDNIEKYFLEGYSIAPSTIPDYFEIIKKGTGECCPFYKNNCRFILGAFIREVYGEENNRIV